MREVHDQVWGWRRYLVGHQTQLREALSAGVTINFVSHGLLSHPHPEGPRTEETAVDKAQILAVDEVHNFLASGSNRTRQVRGTLADHVVMFTATPISRGAPDLLSLVGLLGADNFDDATLEVLDQLDRDARPDVGAGIMVGVAAHAAGAGVPVGVLVGGDQRIERGLRPAHREPLDLLAHPVTLLGEDIVAAERIRYASLQVRGLVQLGRRIRVPASRRREVSEEQWLQGRLAAARGLAGHQILSALCSSRAALIQHLAATGTALDACGLAAVGGRPASGDLLATLRGLAAQGLPEVGVACEVPDWLRDPVAWHAVCAEEIEHYGAMLAAAREFSDARERCKAELLARLAGDHRLVLGFDRHPITLASIRAQLRRCGIDILVAAGGAPAERRRVEKRSPAPHGARQRGLAGGAFGGPAPAYITGRPRNSPARGVAAMCPGCTAPRRSGGQPCSPPPPAAAEAPPCAPRSRTGT